MTADGQVIALDGKVTLDDNADFRQPDHAAFEDMDGADPLEAAAKAKDLNYVKLDGEVGIIGNGAGPGHVAPSTSSPTPARTSAASSPANFLDIGGGASAEVMADGLEIILVRPGRASRSSSTSSAASPRATRSPTASSQALELLEHAARPCDKPLVVRLDGNNADEGRRILAEADHPAGRPGRHHGRCGRRRAAELAA